MKLGFVIPFVGPAVSSAAGLSAFCRGLEDLGYDTLWVGDRLVTPVDMHSTYPGNEQPYPPQMTRYLDPVLLWTVAATATSRVRLNASTFYYEPVHLARYSNSSLVYRVRTTPATSGTPAAELNLTGIAATTVYKELFARYADKESVLPASGSVDFAFDADNPPQDGALLSEPALAMVAVLVLGIETAGKPFGLSVVNKVTENSGALECISGNAIASASQDPVEIVKATLTCIQQVQDTTSQVIIGTLLSGIPVLVSMIQGMWSEVNGTNQGTFTVTATGTRTVKAPDPVSESAPAAGPPAGGCTMDPQSLALLRQSIAAQRATAAQATAAPPSYRASIEASAKVLEDQIAAAGC